MKRFVVAFTLVLTLAFFLLPANSRQDPVKLLNSLDVPVMENAEVTHFKYGGLLAKFIYVRFRADPDSIKAYRSVLPTGKTLNQAAGMMVIADELSDEDMLRLEQQGTEFEWHESSRFFVPWWKIEQIETGTFHYREMPDACRYKVYIDDSRGIVYVSWFYS